jgi:hypothetical protein
VRDRGATEQSRLDASRLEKALHVFIARLAIHITKIVCRGIERYNAGGPAILPLRPIGGK